MGGLILGEELKINIFPEFQSSQDIMFGPSFNVLLLRTSLVAQIVKNLPAMQRPTRVPSPGPEHPLEKGMAAHSSILAWRIPWTEEQPGGLQSMGLQKSDTAEQLIYSLYFSKDF